MQEELTAELYNSWRQHPITQALFAQMDKQIEDIKESWISGHFALANTQASILEQAQLQERAAVFRALISQTGEEFLQAIGGE